MSDAGVDPGHGAVAPGLSARDGEAEGISVIRHDVAGAQVEGTSARVESGDGDSGGLSESPKAPSVKISLSSFPVSIFLLFSSKPKNPYTIKSHCRQVTLSKNDIVTTLKKTSYIYDKRDVYM